MRFHCPYILEKGSFLPVLPVPRPAVSKRNDIGVVSFQKIKSPVFQFAEICARLSDGLPVACWKDLPRPAGVSVANRQRCRIAKTTCPAGGVRGQLCDSHSFIRICPAAASEKIPPFPQKSRAFGKDSPHRSPRCRCPSWRRGGLSPCLSSQKFQIAPLKRRKFPRGCPDGLPFAPR